MRGRPLWLLLIAALLLAPSALQAGGVSCDPPTSDPRPEYAIYTVLGQIRIRLLDQPGEAPATVESFLGYAERGDYDGSFFHRLIPGAVLQGGSLTWDPIGGYAEIPQDNPVANEPGICNVRGTLAMAKAGGMLTSLFVLNLADNTQTLATQVFAAVVPEDMAIVDQIAALHREAGSFFVDDPIAPLLDNLPVLEVLERDPGGWGCIQSISTDPLYRPQIQIWLPEFVQNCADGTAFDAALVLVRAAMDPQIPERLVTIETVPEPGAALQLAAGGATLAGLWLARRRRA